ncbi:MAG: DUF4150 domain-containing protein [Sandaracinaceae bacterium]|nr:DUF4150 domain-containing protein [Sandaracinaceae bacterium]
MFPASTNGGGICNAFPDVCKTPAPPAPFAPIPYPNIGQCTQAKGSTCSSKVKILNKKTFTKQTELSRSMGDEAGTLKGMISSVNMDAVKRTMSYSKVKCEGAEITTVLKMTGHNGSNANAPPGTQTAPSQTKVICMG